MIGSDLPSPSFGEEFNWHNIRHLTR